jgi:hypothetical protein
MKTAKGTLTHPKWDEKPYHEAAPQKSTTAIVDVVFDGDLVGKGNSRALMQYTDEATCHYSGYVIVDGKLDGKAGTFILYEVGVYADATAKSTWEIVKDSGTGALKGISGKGSYSAQHEGTVHYELKYEL